MTVSAPTRAHLRGGLPPAPPTPAWAAYKSAWGPVSVGWRGGVEKEEEEPPDLLPALAGCLLSPAGPPDPAVP